MLGILQYLIPDTISKVCDSVVQVWVPSIDRNIGVCMCVWSI